MGNSGQKEEVKASPPAPAAVITPVKKSADDILKEFDPRSPRLNNFFSPDRKSFQSPVDPSRYKVPLIAYQCSLASVKESVPHKSSIVDAIEKQLQSGEENWYVGSEAHSGNARSASKSYSGKKQKVSEDRSVVVMKKLSFDAATAAAAAKNAEAKKTGESSAQKKRGRKSQKKEKENVGEDEEEIEEKVQEEDEER